MLLEGNTVHLFAPINQFAADVCIDKDTPIFDTSEELIRSVDWYNLTDKWESEMMVTRWHTFTFHSQIACDKKKDATSCRKCFPLKKTEYMKNHKILQASY